MIRKLLSTLTFSWALSLALLLLLAAVAGPPTWAEAASPPDFGRPNPEAAPELAQFAFLIGAWDCQTKYLNADWKTYSEGKATWTARYIVDGFAIQDDFRGGFGEDYIATTFRSFDRRERQWKAYWLDGKRGAWSEPLVQHAIGEGTMTLETRAKTRDPQGRVREVKLHYHFYEIGPKSFRWKSNASLDEGKTWVEDTILIDCKRQR